MLDKKTTLKITFCSLVVLFILILLVIFTDLIETTSYILFIIFSLFTILGIVQIFLSKRVVKDKKLKRLLVINGFSATFVVLFSVFHNLFYALGELISSVLLKNILTGLEVVFFVASVTVLPVIFVVTVVLVLINYLKSK